MADKETTADVQADIDDIVKLISTLGRALMEAESCETADDLSANLEEALSTVVDIQSELTILSLRAEKLSKV